jgi:hypothetical protein
VPIYEIHPNQLTLVSETSFQNEGLRERADIQRLLKDNIQFLEQGLMVLAEEFNGWLESSRRIDLLCLDKQANLVVVELKRDEDGKHMELQALRYAAMVSKMTFDQAVQARAKFRHPLGFDPTKARGDILAFLEWSGAAEDNFAAKTRIILAAADFSKEVTTTVLWLREQKIDIRCTRLRPYRMEDGRLLMDIQPLIPLPETKDFMLQVEEKQDAVVKERAERHDLRLAFLQALLDRAQGRSLRHVGRKPTDTGALIGSIGRAGLSLNYVTAQETSRVELLISGTNPKPRFAKLSDSRDIIENAFGGPLVWYQKENTEQCRVYHEVGGGYRSAEAEWPRIHDELIEAMLRLEAAVLPHAMNI